MYSKIIGTPISILRYKLNTTDLNMAAFDYRNSDKSFKLMSSYDKIRKDLNVVIDIEGENIPVVNQYNHSLDYYTNIIENNKKPTPIRFKSNKSDELEIIEIKFNDKLNIRVPLEPHHEALLFDKKIIIYDDNRSKKSEYHVFKNSMFELNDDFHIFRTIDDDGFSKGYVEGINMFNPIIRLSSSIPFLNNIPKNIIEVAEDSHMKIINLEYDNYGIIKSAISKIDSIKCEYSTYKIDNIEIIESMHNLFFDNFDYNNYFENDKKYSNEIIKLCAKDNYIEFIQIIYDDVEGIESTEYKELSDLDFDNIVDKYFNY